LVLYVWEEQQGKPMWHQDRKGTLVGNVLRAGGSIDITLSDTDPNKAQAVGNFPTRRTAELVRQ
jgi:hypothetical protein